MGTDRQLPPGISESTLDHFSRIRLAQSTLQDPAFRPFPSSRNVTNDGRGHTLTGKTWNTPETIQDLISLHRPSSTAPGTSFPHPEASRSEVRRFYTFGSDMNAHPDLLHGGVIATILDSTLGHAVGMELAGMGVDGDGMRGADRSFTVQLNVTYKKPVKTPGTVRISAWVTRVDDGGRKVWAEGLMESEDDDGGIVLNARGKGMWLRAGGKSKAKFKL